MDDGGAPKKFATVTGTTLLEGLRDPANQTIWTQYVERYRPMIVRYAKRRGLDAEDAEDVAQTSLLAFSDGYRDGRYDRSKGRLRSWLFGIVANEVRAKRRKQEIPRDGEDALAGVEADDGQSAWDEEWQRAVLRECLAQARSEVQPETWRAFELFALEGRSAESVASELATTANAVFLAKRRILARMRELRPLMEDVW